MSATHQETAERVRNAVEWASQPSIPAKAMVSLEVEHIRNLAPALLEYVSQLDSVSNSETEDVEAVCADSDAAE